MTPRLPGPHRATVFDFDGTLADTGALNARAVHHALTVHGVNVPAAWLHTVELADLTAVRRRLRAEYGQQLACADAEFIDTARAWWARHAHTVRAVPHIADLARRAARSGPVAVVSANDGGIVRAGLAAIGLSHLAATLVAREDVPHLKPAPDGYLLAAALLRVPPAACLVYENTDEGITAARTAGMTVVDVRTHPRGTGIGHPPAHGDSLSRAAPYS
ncbi:HAD family hydrolase [Kitasatospora sp. CB01950]|uniref:HAD family hydrolase n=1 Tax=Kitasatospora sp. CB01950 TaxID=1703930 RepID=UPI00093D47CD|nr:HAD family phosphatase [Kitasatospora sp. CB01950]